MTHLRSIDGCGGTDAAAAGRVLDGGGDGNGVLRAAAPQPTSLSSLVFAAWKYLQVCPPTSEFQAEAARELQQALERA